MNKFAIVMSCAILASGAALAQYPAPANREAPPAAGASPASTGPGDFSPGAVGTPTKTVGGATRSVKKDKAPETTDAAAGNKSGDAKAAASPANDKK